MAEISGIHPSGLRKAAKARAAFYEDRRLGPTLLMFNAENRLIDIANEDGGRRLAAIDLNYCQIGS